MKLSLALFSLISAFGQNPTAGGLTVQINGTTVKRGTLNLTSGSGIVETCSDSPSNDRLECASSYNTALIATHDTVEANENYCDSVTGTTAYACRLPFKALAAYKTGMTFLLQADATCSTSCTLNIDGVGMVNLKRIDGTTDPGGTLLARQPQWIFYDGRIFRLMGGGGSSGGSSSAGPQDSRGDVIARRLIGAMDSMSYASTMTLDVVAGDLHKTITDNSVGYATINAATRGLPGQHMWIFVQNDAISGKTITFGANFRSSGALVGSPGKTSTLQFVSDGTAWYEVARTLNL